jgi:hypothetical protein
VAAAAAAAAAVAGVQLALLQVVAAVVVVAVSVEVAPAAELRARRAGVVCAVAVVTQEPRITTAALTANLQTTSAVVLRCQTAMHDGSSVVLTVQRHPARVWAALREALAVRVLVAVRWRSTRRRGSETVSACCLAAPAATLCTVSLRLPAAAAAPLSATMS